MDSPYRSTSFRYFLTSATLHRTIPGALLRRFALFAILLVVKPIHAQDFEQESGAYAFMEGARRQLLADQNLPDRFRIDASYRLRYERLTENFRANSSGAEDVLVHRLLALAEVRLSPVFFAAELQDARAFLADANTPLGTSTVNAAELLQAFAGVQFHDILQTGSEVVFRTGRLTMDLGSRRLVARNRFRNTINAFTGLEARWIGASGAQLAGLFTTPVQRRPTGSAVLDNEVAFDEEDFDILFWGLFATSGLLSRGSKGEVYLFGIHEQDDVDLATLNRHLVTPGIRWYRSPHPGKFDFEIESMLQAGRSRSSSSVTDTTDLDHRASLFHVTFGYTVPSTWTPRLVLAYDRASGDRDPTDSRNNRFDTLFGARRFEFGPTGIYGLLARSNLSSPGVRVEVRPESAVDGFVGYRAVWLAARRDALTSAGVRDITGMSGRFIGHQLEGRLRTGILSKHMDLEAGFAHFLAGKFLKTAPNSSHSEKTTYYYLQINFSY